MKWGMRVLGLIGMLLVFLLAVDFIINSNFCWLDNCIVLLILAALEAFLVVVTSLFWEALP